jgi:hypothetical protein
MRFGRRGECGAQALNCSCALPVKHVELDLHHRQARRAVGTLLLVDGDEQLVRQSQHHVCSLHALHLTLEFIDGREASQLRDRQ